MVGQATVNLDAKLGRALTDVRQRQLIVRRWKFAAAGVLAVTSAVVLAPIANAQLTFRRIAGALDDVDAVTLTHYSISDTGEKAKTLTIEYDHGRWRFSDASRDYQLYRDGKLYSYQDALHAYIVEERPGGPFSYNSSGIGLSAMLRSMETWGRPPSVSLSTETVNGKDMTVATVVNSMDEKVVIYADKATDLPRSAELYAKSNPTQRVGTMTFDYGKPAPTDHFETTPGIEQLSRAESARRIESFFTSTTLASVKLRKQEFVLRKVDVAKDGTVFVSYQVGDHYSGYTGYRLSVSDDLGTEFTEPQTGPVAADEVGARDLPQGKVQQEIFVPLHPSSRWQPRRITVSAHVTGRGEMVQFIGGFAQQSDGTWKYSTFSNTSGVSNESVPPAKPLWSKAFTVPSCEWTPDYFGLISTGMTTELAARIFRAQAIARNRTNYQDTASAREWWGEVVRLQKEYNASGQGIVSTDAAEKELEKLP